MAEKTNHNNISLDKAFQKVRAIHAELHDRIVKHIANGTGGFTQI